MKSTKNYVNSAQSNLRNMITPLHMDKRRKSSIWRSNTYIAATMPKNMRKLFSLIAICHWTVLFLNGAVTANYAKNAARMRGASWKRTNMSKFSREYGIPT